MEGDWNEMTARFATSVMTRNFRTDIATAKKKSHRHSCSDKRNTRRQIPQHTHRYHISYHPNHRINHSERHAHRHHRSEWQTFTDAATDKGRHHELIDLACLKGRSHSVAVGWLWGRALWRRNRRLSYSCRVSWQRYHIPVMRIVVHSGVMCECITNLSMCLFLWLRGCHTAKYWLGYCTNPKGSYNLIIVMKSSLVCLVRYAGFHCYWWLLLYGLL